MKTKHINEIVGAITIAKQYGRNRTWSLEYAQTFYDRGIVTMIELKRIISIIKTLYA